eukprot:TRINITY_DN26490_c0_g1_i1.p1 TRINITY_DN26490_c0_g1~~TRINITY_DN26490_c0_g1_i1.p1  ORF type:complete len:879 (+),score=177.03 TRINITY_DN26490_c0_g1_i1:109-2637(+)
MADEGEANLVEERNQIRQLQSDISRKKEQLERLQQRKKACEEEMSTRRKELEAVEAEFRSDQNKVKKNKTHATAKTQEAESTFMSLKVKETLQERIPTMCPPQEQVDAGETGFNTESKPASGDDAGKPIHDTVLVSYVNLAAGDKKDEDYKVSYRIDGNITVAMLLKDACSYWGCSRHEYTLCRIKTEEPESLDKYMDDKLQLDHILDPSEQSHLHLVRKVDIQAFQDQSLREKKAKKDPKKEETEDSGQSLQTLKHGLKNVTSELVEEPFVKALGAWPGVYRLLKNRQRKRGLVKWHRASLGDILVFLILIALTQLSLDLRRHADAHALRNGVESALVYTPVSQTSTGHEQDFKAVRTVPMALQYLNGRFDYQMFNASSMLRQTYTPVGNMRLRMQKASSRACTRPDIPPDLQERCDHVDLRKQKTDDLEFPATVAYELDQLVNHSNVKGDPRKWRKSTMGSASVYGQIEFSYDGSGYQVWFPVNPSDVAGKSSMIGGFNWLLKQWLTSNTRMLAVETTLADYNSGGFISASIVLEIAPSGAARLTAAFEPFVLKTETTATVLDGFRWAFIAAYLMLVRVWLVCEEEVVQGMSGLTYVFSVSGVVDAAIGAMFIGAQFMQLHALPKDPIKTIDNEHFASYSLFADRQKQLQITEAVLLLLLCVRFTMLMQFNPDIFRFYKLIKRTVTMSSYYFLVAVPPLLSTIYLGNCIWSPYLEGYSSWVRSMMSVVGILQMVIDLDAMQESINYAWTIPFFLYVYFVLFAFFVNGFVAITAYSYFEVELLEKSHPKLLRWTRDQWLDWALWGSVYRRVTGKEPGSSKRIGLEEEEDEERDEDSEGEDD